MKIKFSSVAKKYLASRAVCHDYNRHVLTLSKKCKHLTNKCLNSYLKKRLEETSTITVKNERTILLSLWKFAYENKMIKRMPINIMKVKIKKAPTKAWTIEECKDMISKTFDFNDKKNRKGCNIGSFLRVWLLLGYESGARFGDIFNFKYSDIEDNVLRWTMSKTGDPMTKILSDQCIQYIKELQFLNSNNDPRIIGWFIGRRQASRIMKIFLEYCGLPGSSKFLRRSSATHIEINHPGHAKLHLGHRTTGLAEKNYLDFGQIRTNVPIAPKLL